MEVRRRKVRVTLLYLVLTGMLIVAASILAHQVITEEVIGRGRLSDGLLGWLPFVQSRRVDGVRVAVLRSEQTAEYFSRLAEEEDRDPQEARKNYLAISEFWKDYFQRRRFEVETISDQQLTSSLEEYSMLLVPMVHCLSEDQIQAIKDFLALRRGVVLTHISGSRDEYGEERSWSLTADVMGGEPEFLITREREPRSLHLLSELPVIAQAPPAFELEVEIFDQPLAMRLREDRIKPAAVWAPEGRPLPTVSPDRKAGIAFGEYLGGRVAWLGFSAQSVVSGDPEMWEAFNSVINNSVDWAASRMVAGKAAWPQHQAAAAFSVMPEGDFARAAELWGTFDRRDISAAFFLTPRQTEINRVIVDELSARAEFALQTDFSPTAAGGRENAEELNSLLRPALQEVSSRTEREPRGFSLPTHERIDFTQLAYLDLDYAWITGEHGRAPRFVPMQLQPLFRRRRHAPILIFQSGRDDRWLAEEEEKPPEAIIESIDLDFNRSKSLGGLYSLSLHAHLSGTAEFRELLDQWLETLPRDEVWLVSPGEIAQWWRQRQQITYSITERGRGRTTLMVSNEGNKTVPEFRLFLYPPRLPASLRIRAERIRVDVPEHTIDRDQNRIELLFEEFAARENKTFYLDLNY